MSSERQSNIFKYNFFFWTLFGIWPGRQPSKIYKYCSWCYLFITLFVYNILLTLNLIYTPRSIELLIHEVIFYFTEIAVTTKVLTIIFKRDKILETFELLDDVLGIDDEISDIVIKKCHATYSAAWKVYADLSNTTYFIAVIIPLFAPLIYETDIELPICKYYFLTDNVRQNYFFYWAIYQSFGMYGHMMYNVNIDSFIAGLLFITVNQIKIIEGKLFEIKLLETESKLSRDVQEKILMQRLNQVLKRYDDLLMYCATVQNVIGVAVFVQFGISSLNICVIMCGLLLPSTIGFYIFLVMYLSAMTSQIFVPGLLGTHIKYASENLVFGAYNTDWIPRSEPFKRSIKVFVERANTPIQMTGLTLFPLSLSTFLSIMKSAYSFFTLLRSFQE